MWDDNVEAIKEKKSNNWFIIFLLVAVIIVVMLFEYNILDYESIKKDFKNYINDITQDEMGITVFKEEDIDKEEKEENVEEKKTSEFSTYENEELNFAYNYYVDEHNKRFEKYFDEEVSGKRVIELLDEIISNNKNSNLYLIGIDYEFISEDGILVSGQNETEPYYLENEIKSKIVKNNYYVVKASALSLAYSDEGYLRRIAIVEDGELDDKSVDEINKRFEKYYDENLYGSKVKELMKEIKEYDKNQYKNNKNNYIRIMIDLDKYTTTDNLSRKYLVGVNDVLVSKEEFLEHEMEIIKDDCDYYVDSYQFNSDGSIYVILITDDFNKYKYINN